MAANGQSGDLRALLVCIVLERIEISVFKPGLYTVLQISIFSRKIQQHWAYILTKQQSTAVELGCSFLATRVPPILFIYIILYIVDVHNKPNPCRYFIWGHLGSSCTFIISFFLPLFQESPYPEDKGRRFVFSYFLATDMISIFEPPVRNSGIIGGKYLGRTKVTKPHSSVGNPIYYSPSDFFIGAVIDGRSKPRLGFLTRQVN